MEPSSRDKRFKYNLFCLVGAMTRTHHKKEAGDNHLLLQSNTRAEERACGCERTHLLLFAMNKMCIHTEVIYTRIKNERLCIHVCALQDLRTNDRHLAMCL